MYWQYKAFVLCPADSLAAAGKKDKTASLGHILEKKETNLGGF